MKINIFVKFLLKLYFIYNNDFIKVVATDLKLSTNINQTNDSKCSAKSVINYNDVDSTGKCENSINSTTTGQIKYNESMMKTIKLMDKNYQNLQNVWRKVTVNIEPIDRRLRLTIDGFILSLNLSHECQQSLYRIADGIQNNQLWAFQFFDASGKLAAGLTQGVITSFGDYDQCLQIKSPDSNGNRHTIYGKYCLVKPYIDYPNFKVLEKFLKFSFLTNESNVMTKKEMMNNLNLFKLLFAYNLVAKRFYFYHYGLCMPSTCSANDLTNALQKIVPGVPLEVGPTCDVISEPVDWNVYQMIMLIISLTFIFLVITSTFIQIIYKNLIVCNDKHQSSTANYTVFHQLLSYFSLIEANKRLVSRFRERLAIADGLMFVYVLWITTALSYGSIVNVGFVGYKKIHNSYLINIMKDSKYFWMKSMFPRDSIFLLSGLIISYDYFGDKNEKLCLTICQYIRFAVEKWYRFTVRMVSPMLVLNILSLIGDGPNWHSGDDIWVNICRDKWWKNLLFINNFENSIMNTCNPLSWLLSAIFQLQLIAPIFMIPYKVMPRYGYITSLLIFTFGCFATIAPKVIQGLRLIPYEISEIYTIADTKYCLFRFMLYTDQFVSIFIIGLTTGYILRHEKSLLDLLYHKNKYISHSIGFICLTTSVLGVVWSERFKDINQIPNKLNLDIWFVFGKILWTFGNIWLIGYCFTNTNGYIIRLLKTLPFRVITRLTYTTYFLSYPVIMYRILTTRDIIEISHSSQLRDLYLNLTVMISLAYIVYVFIEHPMLSILESIIKIINKTTKINQTINTCKTIESNNMLTDKLNSHKLDYSFKETCV
ncbi:nose resistant to fluoxetine protein 6-like [Oppia nitens]|uniref:nose resistant to fluoxetine protein 6-like n=1 Tax=Oppia nitens TaxID=1686743 RepID=UPI0023D9A5AF|nr:nose resistant to fluoxetine protein 6-like [Oppia nitens]